MSARAEGKAELKTDGISVNLVDDWRETRLSVFAKREPGEPVIDLDIWPGERLLVPEARVASVRLNSSEALGHQWLLAAARQGIKQTASVTVLAEGAKGIWS